MSEVRIVLAHPYDGHAVNDVITVDEDRGRQLVQAAAGRYAEPEPEPEAVVIPDQVVSAATPDADTSGVATETEKGAKPRKS